MSDNLRTLGGGGGGGLRRFPFSSPSSGLPETQKRPSISLFFSAACLLACKTTNQYINITVI